MKKKGRKLTYEWSARRQKTIIISHSSTLVEECYNFSFNTKSLKVKLNLQDPGVDRAGSS